MRYIDSAMNAVTRISSKIVFVVQTFGYNESNKRTAFN